MDFTKHFQIIGDVIKSDYIALLLSTIVLFVVSIASFGLLAPVAMAGYTQSLLLAIRDGRRPEVRDLFTHFNLFLPLLIFSLLLGAAVFIGLKMLVLPGLVVIAAASYFCLYLLPLMTDREMGLVEALQESTQMATVQPVSEHLVALAVYLVLNAIGSSTGLGAVVTTPVALLFVLSVYEERQARMVPESQSFTGPDSQSDTRDPQPPPPPPGD